MTPISRIRALADFRFALRRFVSFSGEAARETALSPHQHQALLALKAAPPEQEVSVGYLASRLCIRHHSAVGLVNRLVARRLVRRVRSTVDRRHVQLEITSHGDAVIHRLSAAHRDELRRIGPELRRLLHELENEPTRM
jgi:DNA-binding MarR family transcriptional regulator